MCNRIGFDEHHTRPHPAQYTGITQGVYISTQHSTHSNKRHIIYYNNIYVLLLWLAALLLLLYTYLYIVYNTKHLSDRTLACVCVRVCLCSIMYKYILRAWCMYIVHPRADGWTNDNNVSTVRVVRQITLDAIAGHAPGAAT